MTGTSANATGTQREGIAIRGMREDDLPEADRIFRMAFGTFLGVPEPETNFAAGVNMVPTRWAAPHVAAFVAEADDRLAGASMVSRWGSVGVFGPIVVRPEFWDRGVGSRLMAPVTEALDQWGVDVGGLFTFPTSAKHIGLYQKFGFWPRFLTRVMSRPAGSPSASSALEGVARFSRAGAEGEATREEFLKACGEITGDVYAGLEVSGEVLSAADQNLCETLLLWDGDRPEGVAACHCGAGTEAGHDQCYVKFAAVRPGPRAASHFTRLLEACEGLAVERGLETVQAGINTGRQEACQAMADIGFRSVAMGPMAMHGLTMHRPSKPAYDGPGVFAIEDWR
ncbi:MAG: GNAT family N-acetyltransferase [Chloroflexota bacterium]